VPRSLSFLLLCIPFYRLALKMIKAVGGGSSMALDRLLFWCPSSWPTTRVILGGALDRVLFAPHAPDRNASELKKLFTHERLYVQLFLAGRASIRR